LHAYVFRVWRTPNFCGKILADEVHPRDVFADVITDRAAAVIIAHNHPSGDLQPSDEDMKTQIRLVEAGKILGIRVLDHLIVSRKGYLSFEESGLIGT
jgi:DNA repair protein RadC